MLAWQKVPGLTSRRLEFGLIDHAAPLAHHVYGRRVPGTTCRHEPRDPTQSVLFQVVRDHYETFRVQAA